MGGGGGRGGVGGGGAHIKICGLNIAPLVKSGVLKYLNFLVFIRGYCGTN